MVDQHGAIMADGPSTSSSSSGRGRGRAGSRHGVRSSKPRQQPETQGRRGKKNDQSRPVWVERRVGSTPAAPSGHMEGLDSSLPQLVQDLQQKLMKAEVECMICYDCVGRRTPIWSCSGCYSIFHITCIRKWATAPTSGDRSTLGDGDANWRCPGCQAVQRVSPGNLRYTCFCGQQLEPPLDFYITPHSCGGPCKKPLEKTKGGQCQHLCTLQCHPGPCPPCVAFAPSETCGCGRTTVIRRCVERDKGMSCGQVCGRLLACKRHRCDRICHEDECGPCEAAVVVSCFCQRKQEHLACGVLPVKGNVDRDAGVFSCESPCSKPLSCGNHSCPEKCHPGPCGECKLLPAKVTTCPCGHRSLGDFPEKRTTCTDPIPTCGQVCDKVLPCSEHRCKVPCHVGPCPPCEAVVEQSCRCGGSVRTAKCYTKTRDVQDDSEAFTCDRKCGVKKSCGRHRCSNVCCPASSPATGVDPHFCMLECGKKLRCGQHICQELCHPGHCPPCLQSSFTELSCACGKSSIPPPVPCGTPRPVCESLCPLSQACGHPATHTCHFGECPPCKVPVAKECVGKHMVMRNVPCGSKDIKCNLQCGKTRRCKRHACKRLCHSDPCDAGLSSGTLSCGQSCGAPRSDCGHPCVAPCHPGSMCPDTRCNFVVDITCGCKRMSAKVLCDAGKRKLACDDECAKSEKLKALADALGIGAAREALAADGVPEVVQETLRRDAHFVAEVEDRFKYLLSGPKSVAGAGGVRVHVFCSLPKDKREVIHQLAQRWFLSVSSVGWDPRRYMVVHVNPKSKVPPARLTKPGLTSPKFNPAVDVDPRLVVGLFNMPPKEADVSGLVLRFGGECELIWLNDRNAVAIFSDVVRAATALRRVDNASVYHGAVVMVAAAALSKDTGAVWGKSLIPKSRGGSSLDPEWVEDKWEDEIKQGAWYDPKATSVAVSNPWSALGKNASSSSAAAPPDDWEEALE